MYQILLLLLSFTNEIAGKSIDQVIYDATAEHSMETGQRNNGQNVVRFDGDILMTEDQYNNLFSKNDKRNAIKSKHFYWKDKVIPYYIEPGVFSTEETDIIEDAFQEWRENTCIDFKRLSRPTGDYVKVTGGGGCSSWIGYQRSGGQELNLAKGCRIKEIVVHEVGHAIGFYHEQARPDRDDYVTVHLENAQKWSHKNFKKLTWDKVHHHGVDYDYYSVMHYGAYEFTLHRGEKKTITTKGGKYDAIIGEQKGASFKDIKMVNIWYKCAGKNSNAKCDKKSCPGDGFVDKNCDCICPGNKGRGFPTKKCGKGKITKKPTTDCDIETTPKTTRKTKKTTRRTTRRSTKRSTKKPSNCKDRSSRCPQYITSCKRSSWIRNRCKKTCSVC